MQLDEMTLDRSRPVVRRIIRQSTAFWLGVIALSAVMLLILNLPYPAKSQMPDPAQCPPGAKSCKVVIVTPEEEATLAGDEMIFSHAEWANRVKFSGIIPAWRQKLLNAPLGKVVEEPKKP